MSEKTMNTTAPEQRMDTLSGDGKAWQYPSAAASGHTEVVLPALPGSPNAEERLLARDFGPHVASRIESAMNQQGYLKSGPQQKPSQVFAHYVAVARGSQLMDAGALRRMEKLAAEFEAESEQAEYFSQVLRPWLHGLTPGKR